MTKSRILRPGLILAFSAAFAGVAGAQKEKELPKMADLKPGELLTYGIRDAGAKSLKDQTKTVIVPTAILEVAVDGDVWMVNKGGAFSKAGTAKAHGKYQVAGLDKAFIQDLAKKAQDDFAERLRAAGYTVKLWDDVKADPEMVKQDRFDVDKDYGMPAKEVFDIHYVIGAPTDEQALKGGLRTYVWSMRKIAKANDALVAIPQYTIRAPQMGGEKSSGYSSNSASISVSPDLSMGGAILYFVNQKESGGMLIQEGANRVIAENVGKMNEVGKDNYSLGSSAGSIFGGGGEIKGMKVQYGFTADREKYAAAAMLAMTSFNQQMVDLIKKAAK